jgi:hypothetical protein
MTVSNDSIEAWPTTAIQAFAGRRARRRRDVAQDRDHEGPASTRPVRARSPPALIQSVGAQTHRADRQAPSALRTSRLRLPASASPDGLPHAAGNANRSLALVKRGCIISWPKDRLETVATVRDRMKGPEPKQQVDVGRDDGVSRWNGCHLKAGFDGT